jgi:hypothetical protein
VSDETTNVLPDPEEQAQTTTNGDDEEGDDSKEETPEPVTEGTVKDAVPEQHKTVTVP